MPPQECDAIWPDRGPTDDSSLPFTCVLEDSSGSGGKRCVLGDAPCIDGMGPAECKAAITETQTWCVPSALCDTVCRDNANPLCLYGALQHPTLPQDKHPTLVHCKVPVEVNTGQTGLTVCRGGVSANIDVSLPVPASTSCSRMSIGAVMATQIGPFSDVRTATAPLNEIRVGLTSQCQATIAISGDFSTTINNVAPQLVLKLDLSNHMSLVVPLLVDLEPVANVDECVNAQLQCFVEVADPDKPIDESLGACVRF
jgi:hypothetical protein